MKMPAPTAEDLKTRFIGFCAICQQDHKLTPEDKRLVHHGYKRPGHGSIVGDCFCVHREPYEVSCEPVKEYLSIVKSQRDGLVKSIARWKKNPPHYFEEQQRTYSWPYEDVTVSYSRFVTCPYVFDSKVQSKVNELEWTLKMIEREIERLEGWISKWEPRPIRTIEEEMQKKAADAAARKAERDAARAARDAKKAATRAKQDALKDRRKAIKAEIIETLKKLAASKPGKDADAKAVSEYSKAVKKLSAQIRRERSWLWPNELKADAELVEVGLAMWVPGHGGNRYAHYHIY